MPKRSYFEEITEMYTTWETITSESTMMTKHLSAEVLKGTAYCIGSGGSLVLAKLWEYLHEELGLGFAKILTPYEFNNVHKESDLVVLFSASGKNHDILQVFKTAIQRGSRVLVFTIAPESALIRLVESNAEKAYAVYPTKKISKDGFLAVTSTIATLRLISHFLNNIFGEEYPNFSPVQLAIDHHLNNLINWDFSTNYSTLQIITSDYGVPAGVDLETRLAESGVASGFLTDPRNFGHGRFIWLDKHPKETKVVLINTLRSQHFMGRLEKSLPKYIDCYRIDSPYDGLLGAIYCITRSILLFGELAQKRGLDPGKPDVPDWGRKVHSLRLGQRDLHTSEVPKSNYFDKYPALTMQFSGIVMDLDGTLIDTKERFGSVKKEIGEEINRLLRLGLRFGFSTGRGDSALDLLKEHIANEFWNDILIGLYNGTLLMKMSENFKHLPETVWPTRSILDSLLRPICNELKATISSHSTQITIRDLASLQQEYIQNVIIAHLGQRAQFIKIQTTGHSLDILPHWSTKLTVVEAIADGVNENILCVGDQGQIAGNDEELLKWKPSVSVGKNRPVSNACLWLGHNKNLQESNGTLALLKAIEAKDNLFVINSTKLSTVVHNKE
ncbi:hypothetical protein UNSWDHB_643 [Dehalobacter sp. UNSWDHB]|nr:hypothetical protein UNSWDHB_643 [Dehalobacter sp. UNSWDHB]